MSDIRSKVTINGVNANLIALDKADELNLERAAAEGASKLAPKVAANTSRVSTGRYKGAWDSRGVYLINPTDYAGYQEFGTSYVSADMAIARTMKDQSDTVRAAFEVEQERAAKKAGW